MPTSRRTSGGRHRAPAAPERRRPRVRAVPAAVVKSGLALALALSLGGYTVAESATQRAAAVQAEQHAEQRRVQAREVAQEERAAVAAERERAVATAQEALADAGAVQTVAATAVTQEDLAPLVEAVGELTALLGEVPDAPLPAVPGEPDATGTDASASEGTPAAPTPAGAAVGGPVAAAADGSGAVVDRTARASRSTARTEPSAALEPTAPATPPATDAPSGGAAPFASATPPAAAAPSATAVPAAEADPAAAAQVAADAADQPATAVAGVAAADGGVGDATDAPAPADDAAPSDELSAQILAVVARVTEVAAQVQATADANLAAQQAAAAAAAAAAAEAEAAAAAAAAAEKEAQRVSLDAYANGRIPEDALCTLPIDGGHQLRCDAADALTALDAAFQGEFGTPLTISDSYRSYSAQVACRRVKGYLCATPGTSNHGWGLAVDLAGGVQTFGTRQHRWMAANAGQYGWILPDWASARGSKPEPWHWEYTG